jgi:hypothetical protein
VQVAGEHGLPKNPVKIAKTMLKVEGALGFYKGIDSAMVKELTYTTTRFGVFYNLMDYA